MLEQPEKVFGWKKLENLYYRDRKFSVEVASDQSQGQGLVFFAIFTTTSSFKVQCQVQLSYPDLSYI